MIDQVPTGAVDTNSSIMLKCTVKGGKPLAILTWNCTGNITTNTSEDTSFSIVEFSVTKHNHGMVCICLATHSIASYQHTARHIVNVICEYINFSSYNNSMNKIYLQKFLK